MILHPIKKVVEQIDFIRQLAQAVHFIIRAAQSVS